MSNYNENFEDKLYDEALERISDFTEMYDEEIAFCTMQDTINYEIPDRSYEDIHGPNSYNEYSEEQEKMNLSWDNFEDWHELSSTTTEIIFKPNGEVNVKKPIAFFTMTSGGYEDIEVEDVESVSNCTVENIDDYWFVYTKDPKKESKVNVSIFRCCED